MKRVVSCEPSQVVLPQVSKACCTHSSLSPVTDCSDARSLCAQFCGYPFSCVPQWLLKRLDRNTRHTVASVFVQAAQHSSNGRRRTGTHKFTQEQVSHYAKTAIMAAAHKFLPFSERWRHSRPRFSGSPAHRSHPRGHDGGRAARRCVLTPRHGRASPCAPVISPITLPHRTM